MEAYSSTSFVWLLLVAGTLLIAASSLALPILQKLSLSPAGQGRSVAEADSSETVSVHASAPLHSRRFAYQQSGDWSGVVLATEPSFRAALSPAQAAAPLPQRQPLASVRASGEVYINETLVPQDSVLYAGDVLRTGPRGAAVLQAPERGTLLISERTRLAFAGPRGYFATLEEGSVSFAASGAARRFEVRVGRFVVTPSPEATECAAEIERAPDAATRVRATRGAVGIIDLEGPQTIFIAAGQQVAISAAGLIERVEVVPGVPAEPTRPPAAEGPEERPKGHAGWIALGIGAGAAAGAAAFLAGRKGPEAVSPSAP